MWFEAFLMSIPTPTLNLPIHTYPYPKLTLKIMQIYDMKYMHNLIGSMFRRYTGIQAWDDHSTAAHEAFGANGNSIIINNHFIWDACNECKSYSNMSWFKSHLKCLYHIGHNTKIRSDWNLTQNFIIP